MTLPTAQDVTYQATVDTIIDDFGINALNVAQISSIASNETIYLAPFLSWIYKPKERFFHQGFLQVEVAANPSRVHTNAAGFFTFDTNGDTFFDPSDPTDTTLAYATPPLPIFGIGSGTVSQDLHPQVLLRLTWALVTRFTKTHVPIGFRSSLACSKFTTPAPSARRISVVLRWVSRSTALPSRLAAQS